VRVGGLGPEMAQAITDAYATPAALNDAYAQCGEAVQVESC
jgi:hypothetical protein